MTGYLELLQSNASEIDSLFNDLLINVTTFFRDPKVFQALKQRILPKIVKAHPAEVPLRIWVCGCSTGEEAYSLAMTIMEYFENSRTHRPVQIFATDISEAGIEKARDGIYHENITADVSPERLRRFFNKVDGRYQIHKSIRDMCVFARQNAAADPPFSNMDLISCRNMMIYPSAERCNGRSYRCFITRCARTDFCFWEARKRSGRATELFTLLNKRAKIYGKKASLTRPTFEIPHRTPSGKRNPARGGNRWLSCECLTSSSRRTRSLLRDFSPAAVVINSQMEIVHFRGRTGDYLEHAPGAASLNLLKMARDNVAVDLRTGRQQGDQAKH